MKYYIATSTARAGAHNTVRDLLNSLGHEITYDWTLHGSVRQTSVPRLREVAHAETEGLAEAEFVIVLLPGGKGTHTELGFSIASQKRLFIHSASPSAFETGPEACAFYHHRGVIQLFGPIEQVAQKVHANLEMALGHYRQPAH